MAMEITRRQLLASGGAVVLASFALPKNLRKLLEFAPTSPADRRAQAGSLSKIEHVVVLMQENRSFDHYFGTMPGVRGFADPTATKQVFYQPDADNPDGYLLPFHVDTFDSSAQALPSNSHSWGPQHQSWANGAMNGFVTAHLAADGVAGQYTMAYFERQDIPFHWALADAFTVCDGYHCSMLGPDLAEPALPDDRPGQPRGWAGRTGFLQFRPPRGLLLDHLPGVPDRGRRVVEGVPGGRQLRDERPRVLRPVPERTALLPAVPKRHARLPGGPVRVRRLARPAARRCRGSSRPRTSPSTRTSFPLPERTSSPASSTPLPPTRHCGKRRCSCLIYDENDGLFDHVLLPRRPPAPLANG